ncbi:MAG TPA: circadian clock KaiB family protein [Terracidiphilus sp.]|nr:circadian clock KaiB family protein [Terracidiphilus sp.]
MSTSNGNIMAPQPSGPPHRVRMTLFVAGEERNSQAARTNLARICESHLSGRADVEIVDVLQDHRKALEWRVLLTPALLIFNADRPTRVTGTLQEAERVLSAINRDYAGSAA